MFNATHQVDVISLLRSLPEEIKQVGQLTR